MPFKGFFKLFARKDKTKDPKAERKHPYDEVDEKDLQTNQAAKRRERQYDEIEIDDDTSGPTLVNDSSAKPETLNYIEVEVQSQNPTTEVKRAEPPTTYTTIDVAATSSSGARTITLAEQ